MAIEAYVSSLSIYFPHLKAVKNAYSVIMSKSKKQQLISLRFGLLSVVERSVHANKKKR